MFQTACCANRKAYRFRKPGHVEQHIAGTQNVLGQLAVDASIRLSASPAARGPGCRKAFPPACEGLKDANRIRIGLDALRSVCR